ncbi:MAG: hypothetical protein HDS21_00235 [Bacteroides sp.]|nr:hypothetical protein [Bacteroides sp.]
MEKEKTKQLLRETLTFLTMNKASMLEVVEFAELVIINAWRRCDLTNEGIDAICRHIDATLRPTMEEALEEAIIDKVINEENEQ